MGSHQIERGLVYNHVGLTGHGLRVYPNLAAKLVVNGLDQLWVSDITYIRLGGEFVYLAVVLDAFSRRVIGWQLSRRLDAGFTVAALQMALQERQPEAGLVHHSGRGVQYAAAECTDLLKARGVQISMSACKPACAVRAIRMTTPKPRVS